MKQIYKRYQFSKNKHSVETPNRFLCPNSFFYPEIHDGESKFVAHNTIYCSLCRNAVGKTNQYGVPILRDGNNYDYENNVVIQELDLDRLEYTRSYVHLLWWYSNVNDKLFQCPIQRILMKIACYEQLLNLCHELNEIDHERYTKYISSLREWTSTINSSSPNMIVQPVEKLKILCIH